MASSEFSSQGCWLGLFGTGNNLFCEVNVSGTKPNLEYLTKEEPSGGCWFGTFCRQRPHVEGEQDGRRLSLRRAMRSNSNKKSAQRKSHMVCDGGGWMRSQQQRSSFMVVVQDEIVKNHQGSKTTKTSVKAIKAAEAAPASRRPGLKSNQSVSSALTVGSGGSYPEF